MSVVSGRIQATFCKTFVDELLLNGVRNVVLCPGSRSTPLAVAAAESELRVHVRLDERSAGFFALGLAKSITEPVLVVVTSGTAVAELLPSVVEANLEGVPLIVATADRPPELHNIGSAQTIDQEGIFGSHVVFTSNPGVVNRWPLERWRPMTSRLVLEAQGSSGRRGPVHLNLPFVDPLVAEADPIPAAQRAGQPHFEFVANSGLPGRLPAVSERTVVIAGLGCGSTGALLDGASTGGWPVVADSRSGCRSGHPNVVVAADAILRSELAEQELAPEVIVLLGAPPASKTVNEWVARCAVDGAAVVVVGSQGPAQHPLQTSAVFIPGDGGEILEILASNAPRASTEWLALWQGAEHAAQSILEAACDDQHFDEPGVARWLTASLDGAVIVSSSSMPIRDLEWFGTSRQGTPLVFSNRGANGIDGVLSTAMGIATGIQQAVVALVGDLTFFHDLSSLVDGVEETASLLIVVVDNNGGGIFSFLPQHSLVAHERFEQLFGTPRTPSVSAVARGFGFAVEEVRDFVEFERAVREMAGSPGINVVVAKMPSRDQNVLRHEDLNRQIKEAVEQKLQ